MDPETKGVWMSTSPFKKTLDDGKEVTVILLDTEGFGSHAAYGDSEINIFCLTVLLSSVLIYNSVGVPRADDLCKFNWVLQLVNAVKIRNENGTTTEEEFIHFFPNFLWLLRDVQLVPKIDDEEVDVKEYILRKVFQLEPNEKKRVTKQNNEIRTAMLTYFPDFEVYSLPLPSADVDVLGNMDSGFYRESLKLNFVEAVDDFPAATAKTMKAKTAWPFAGCVNGTQFAELLTHYVQSLKSGPVDLLSVWDNVLNTVYHYAVSKAFDHYKAAMLDFVNKESPCHEDVIITEHGKVHQGSLGIFKENTRSIKVATMTETYVQQLVEKIAVYDEMNNAYSTGLLPQLLEINIKRSRAFCRGLARELVESKLRGLDVKKCADDDATFKDIEKVLQEIDEMYDDRARRPQKLEIYEQEIAKAIMRFYNDNIEYLSQLKYFRPPQEAEKIREAN
ncbi:guanylate-binding protein 6-like [Ptychodera flava]|uniref:guanylate-binding protein 6-like n=1 Tax=Ptychodera flava TaxID=63121 RepID=UPI00396A5907